MTSRRAVALAALTPRAGETARGMVSVPGTDPVWEMPAYVVRGARPGPTLAVTAGLHAAEYAGIGAVTELCRSLDPATLRGTLIALPLVNTPGFFERTPYLNPRDGRNCNRVFPGHPDGDPSERVAAFLTDQLFAGATAYVDVHGGDLVEALVPFALCAATGNADLDARSVALGEAYGLDHLLVTSADTVPGAAYATAAARGIPAIIAEVGQQGIYDRESVDRHVRGLRSVLAAMDMLPGGPGEGPAAAPPQRHESFVWLRADVSGCYHPCVTVGDHVEAGASIGDLRDLMGDRVRELAAPASGTVLFLLTALAVRAGDPLIGIGAP